MGGRDLAFLCPEQRVSHGDQGWGAAMCSLVCTNGTHVSPGQSISCPPTEGDCVPRRPGSLTSKLGPSPEPPSSLTLY